MMNSEQAIEIVKQHLEGAGFNTLNVDNYEEIVIGLSNIVNRISNIITPYILRGGAEEEIALDIGKQLMADFVFSETSNIMMINQKLEVV